MKPGSTLRDIGEFGLIEMVRRACGTDTAVPCGIGDDAAVLPLRRGVYQLMTSDTLVEGRHFSTDAPPAAVGHKVLACSISDIAAMGGTPTYAVLSLGARSDTATAAVKSLYRGLLKLAHRFGVHVVGGDTVTDDKLTVSVTLLGEVRQTELVTRCGARPHDTIFVSGPIGGSLKSGRHLRFEPRWKESRWLATSFRPTAMIDISDGLIADLGHLLHASGVGADVFATRIPLHRGVDLQAGLTEGEDFELLFTLRPRAARRLMRLQQPPFRCYPIGHIVPEKERLTLISNDGERTTMSAVQGGYRHFA